jgi:hypothetical protein
MNISWRMLVVLRFDFAIGGEDYMVLDRHSSTSVFVEITHLPNLRVILVMGANSCYIPTENPSY